MTDASFQPNSGKALVRDIRGVRIERLPIKTHVISDKDAIADIVAKYAAPHLKPHDTLAVSERVVAISQGRAFPVDSITPSWLAKLLVRFVFKPSWGIGIGSPWTMELALREAGAARVLVAAAASALTKPFGVRGVFYRVVGNNISAIDGPTSYTMPPYNMYAKLPPKDPAAVAQSLADQFHVNVAIIDANDIGVALLGASSGVDETFIKDVFRDNPLGQTNEQTPLCIVREAQ